LIEYGRFILVSMILVALLLFVPLLLAVSRLVDVIAVPLTLLPVVRLSLPAGVALPGGLVEYVPLLHV
jgi:hypothetical protein